ncbi:MAG: Ig-like domain-containing protein [Candidatus Thorarchaeota archaeon]
MWKKMKTGRQNKNKILLILRMFHKKQSNMRTALIILLVLVVLQPELQTPFSVTRVDGTSGNFVEDFTTTALSDTAATNVTGWGAGSVYLPKKNFAVSGSWTDGSPRDVVITGDYALVPDEDSDNRFFVVNVSDPTTPTTITSVALVSTPHQIKVAGDYAYVTVLFSGVQIFNISNILNPISVATYPTTDATNEICIDGNYAYVGNQFDGLQIVNITDPANPSNASAVKFPTSGWASSVFVKGNYAYVTTSQGGGLYLVNITNPFKPTIAGNYSSANAADVVVEGNFAYLVDTITGILILDIRDPTNPSLVGQYPRGAWGPWNIFVDGDYAYVGGYSDGLFVLNITNPINPILAGSVETITCYRAYVSGNYAYAGGYTSGMFVVKISDPVPPNIVGDYPNSGYNEDVFVEGDYAYLAAGAIGLIAVNITDPTTPTVVGSYNTPGYAEGIFVDGHYAYVADNQSGLLVINITDPTALNPVGSYDTSGYALEVYISGNFAYVADGSSGLKVLNITDPTDPTLEGSYSTPDQATAVVVAGDFAYVTVASSGLYVLNITNPLIPSFAGSCDTAGTASGVAIEGDYAFVADGASGIQLINITKSTDPTIVGGYSTSDTASDIVIKGDYAYIAESGAGLRTINITKPTSPTSFGVVDTPDSAKSVYVSGDYAYIADGSSGMQVVQVRGSILRQFASPRIAQSLIVFTSTIDDLLTNATLTTSESTPPGSSITYYLSADNGVNWEQVTLGSMHFFTNVGYQLKWRAILYNSNPVVTPIIFSVSISYDTNLPPTITGPSDFSIYFGDTGISILWTATDLNPSKYTVFRNETTIYDEGSWTTSVLIWIDNLAEGKHNFTCVINDTFGAIAKDEVWVTVLPSTPDLTPPLLSSPENISFEEGSIGYSIVWSGSDDRSPWWATIWKDTTIIYNQAWIGNDIEISLDGLIEGMYTYNCTLFDEAGNYNSSIVFVTVTPKVPDNTPPNIIPPNPIEYEKGTTGHNLLWHCIDDHPYAYRITINDTEILYNAWHGENITNSVDNLELGIWVVKLTLWDLEKNNFSASTYVTVIPPLPDTTPPLVNQPAELIVAENIPGIIVWEVSDDHPGRYIILRNNSIILEQDYWTSGIIQYYFVSLPQGTWEFNLTVWDEAGNTFSSTALVKVVQGSEIDTKAPQISQHPDVQFEYGTTGNTLIFYIFDEHPKAYSLSQDGVIVTKITWKIPNRQVMYSLDGLNIGSYRIKITAWDIYNQTASLTVRVKVTGDNTPPTINLLPDFNFPEGHDVNITWIVSDENPSRFEVILLPEDEIVKSGTWSGEDITIPLSEYTEGTYHFRCVVYDASGNFAFDDVIATISKGQSAPGFEFFAIIPFLILISPIKRRRDRRLKE